MTPPKDLYRPVLRSKAPSTLQLRIEDDKRDNSKEESSQNLKKTVQNTRSRKSLELGAQKTQAKRAVEEGSKTRKITPKG